MRRVRFKAPALTSAGLGRYATIESLEARQLLAAQVYDGALNGKIVYTSAGHGWQWNTTLNRYATDRGEAMLDLDGNNTFETPTEMIEDFGNQDQMSFYADYLLRAGATVVPMRPVGHQTREVVLDNDSAGVTFTGSWANSTSTTHYDEDYGAAADSVAYRTAVVNTAAETAVATYQPTFAAAGFYPVYTWALSGTNRTDQLYRVNHTGGSTEIKVDHRKVGKGWVYLGTYYFGAGSSAAGNVQVSNFSSVAGNAVADAIRFGNGMGDYVDSPAPGVSGYAREDENSYAWLRRGLGVGVTATSIIGSDNVSAPSLMAKWMNTDSNVFGTSVYIGFHSNAAGGRGAVGLIDADVAERTPHQADLALYTGRQINQDLQALNGTFEYNWSTRTTHTYTGEFGEINEGASAEMDATIIEVGFHDQIEDARLMRDPKVRDQIGRSTYEATLEYFDAWGNLTAPASQPQAPQGVRAIADASGNVTLNWSAPASRTGGPGAATAYRVYTSRDGYGFSNPVQVTGTTLTLPAASLDGNAYYFKIAALNAGGESPGSVVVGARKNGAGGGGGTNRVLVVNGFDRLERSQNERFAYAYTGDRLIDRVRTRYNNTRDYVAQFGEAVEAYAAGGDALGFDTVQNEQVASGAINLANYRAVLWISGDESTDDESFSAIEQTKLSTFLTGGGRLFVSGAEIGWDLDGPTAPTTGDVSFYNNVLRANYVSDDANTYTASGVTGSIFAGLSLAFDDGANSNDDNVYNVAFADVLGVSGDSTLALNYSGGVGGAATQYSAGTTGARVINMGFPFETITTPANRNAVMARVLTFFEAAVSTAPTSIDLVASTDTGASNSDNLTSRDNDSAANALQFVVAGTTPGAAVTLYADGIAIGSGTGQAGSTTVTTNGTTALLDGARSITARQAESGRAESSYSPALVVTIDTVAPTADVVDVSPDPRTSGVASVTITFSRAVIGFDLSDLSLVRDGGPNLLSAGQTLTTSDNVTFTLSNLNAITSTSGAYALTVTAAGSGITNAAGNSLAASASDAWTHSLPTWLAPGSAATWNSSAKTLNVTGTATITADPGPDAPVVTANGSAAVLMIDPGPASQVRLGGLSLSGGAAATLTGSDRVLVVGSLSVADGAKLDLSSNAMVIQNGTLPAVQATVVSGFNNGDWKGAGITSSSAETEAKGLTALGYATNAELGFTTFDGVTVDSDDILVKYTYYGDADLSGTVTLDDFNQFLFGYQNQATAAKTWLNGDFDFSNTITLDDFNQFLYGKNNQGGAL